MANNVHPIAASAGWRDIPASDFFVLSCSVDNKTLTRLAQVCKTWHKNKALISVFQSRKEGSSSAFCDLLRILNATIRHLPVVPWRISLNGRYDLLQPAQMPPNAAVARTLRCNGATGIAFHIQGHIGPTYRRQPQEPLRPVSELSGVIVLEPTKFHNGNPSAIYLWRIPNELALINRLYRDHCEQNNFHPNISCTCFIAPTSTEKMGSEAYSWAVRLLRGTDPLFHLASPLRLERTSSPINPANLQAVQALPRPAPIAPLPGAPPPAFVAVAPPPPPPPPVSWLSRLTQGTALVLQTVAGWIRRLGVAIRNLI